MSPSEIDIVHRTELWWTTTDMTVIGSTAIALTEIDSTETAAIEAMIEIATETDEADTRQSSG